MKRTTVTTFIITALAVPAITFAQDKADPGKSGDATKNPPSSAPARGTASDRTGTARDPGKSSDSVAETDPTNAERQFVGPITLVNREERTITINDRTLGFHQLRIGDGTKLKRGEKVATWEDLKVGVNVDGTSRGNATMSNADTVNIGG